MRPDALLELIDDFERFARMGNDLYDRLASLSDAVRLTRPDGSAEEVLLRHLQSLLDGAKGRLGHVSADSVASGGSAGALQMALGDLRKAPEFVTAFAHIRRSKNMSEDLGGGFADESDEEQGGAYAPPRPKSLTNGNGSYTMNGHGNFTSATP
jgi:hypothetical protein